MCLLKGSESEKDLLHIDLWDLNHHHQITCRLEQDSLNNSINPLHLHFSFFCYKSLSQALCCLMLKTKIYGDKFISKYFLSIYWTTHCTVYCEREMHTLALNWRKWASTEMDRYYHLL